MVNVLDDTSTLRKIVERKHDLQSEQNGNKGKNLRSKGLCEMYLAIWLEWQWPTGRHVAGDLARLGNHEHCLP